MAGAILVCDIIFRISLPAEALRIPGSQLPKIGVSCWLRLSWVVIHAALVLEKRIILQGRGDLVRSVAAGVLLPVIVTSPWNASLSRKLLVVSVRSHLSYLVVKNFIRFWPGI